MTKQTASAIDTGADAESIKEKVLGYIDAWYQGEAKRGEKSLHPELAKRIVRTHPETGQPL